MFIKASARPTFFRAIKLGSSLLPIAMVGAIFEFLLPVLLDAQKVEIFYIGVFISFSWLITTFIDLLWGRLIDAHDKRYFIVLGVILFVGAIYVFSWTTRIELLLLLTIVAYIGYDIFYIAMEGFLIDISNKKYFNYATSGFFPMWQIGYIIGPFVATALALQRGYHETFAYMPVALVLAGIVFFSFFHRTPVKQIEEITPISLRAFFADIMKREYMILFGIFMCAFWYSVMTVGIPLVYVIEDNNLWYAALVSCAFAVPFVFTDMLGGIFAKNRHRRFLFITVGFLLGGCSLILFFLTTTLWAGMVTVFLSTVGVNIAWATFEIEAGLIADNHSSGAVESVFVFWKNIGWDTSPFVFGVISSFWGIKMPFILLGCLFVFLSFVFIRKHVQIK